MFCFILHDGIFSLLVSVSGVEGKVCNHFLLSKGNDPNCLCVACRGKSCKRKKKHERKAKASSSSFSGFSPLMPVPYVSCRCLRVLVL